MQTMINTREQAIAKSQTITKGYAGMCLAFVKDCYNAQAVHPSAISAWNTSTHKHATTDLSGIPRGAPIFFAPHGSPYGHVAIYLGDGTMRTTNSSTGLIHTDPVSIWTHQYGYTLLGWTDDIEGQLIPESTTTQQTTGDDDDMQCIIQPNGENRLVYFDGQQCHNLTHPDQVTALQMVAKQCGKTLPTFKLGSAKAPWYTRLTQAIK
ncbi:MAG: NlpC/P60 family protein [Bifidobacterium crudilactis]